MIQGPLAARILAHLSQTDISALDDTRKWSYTFSTSFKDARIYDVLQAWYRTLPQARCITKTSLS